MYNKRFIYVWLMVVVFLFFHNSILEAQMTQSGIASSVRQKDQQRMVESKMYMMQRQKTEVRQQPGDLKYMFDKFTEKVKRALEGLRAQRRNTNTSREQMKARMDAIKEQMRLQKYRQEALQASQEDRLRSLKDRMESLARQRKDLMDFQTRR